MANRCKVTDADGDELRVSRLGRTDEVIIGIEEDESSHILSVWLKKEQAREVANTLLEIIAEIESENE